MATSYICEHSAEFSIVPYVKSLLEREFKYVAPISPWLSRELSGKSKRIHKDSKFYVLVLFPRRPKTSANNKLFITINDELETFKKIGIKHGIPVIAGCPKATDFWELASCKEHILINIGHPDTYEYLISIDSIASSPNMPCLSDKDILNTAKEGKEHTMESFENFVREARYSQPPSFFGGRYKPVYFLMKVH